MLRYCLHATVPVLNILLIQWVSTCRSFSLFLWFRTVTKREGGGGGGGGIYSTTVLNLTEMACKVYISEC